MNMLNLYETPAAKAPQVSAETESRLHAAPFSIRRMGKRPLAFEGAELCMAMSFVPGMPYWFEIGIFRTTEHKFVVAIKTFYSSEQERDISRAWMCESFPDAMDIVEGHDPAADIRLDVGPEQDGLCAAELAAHAFALRARVAEARRQYASLVGEILHDLENG